jgi:hypothetical protein
MVVMKTLGEMSQMLLNVGNFEHWQFFEHLLKVIFMESSNIINVSCTTNYQLSSIQVSRILQLAKISEKIHHFYEVI